MFTAQLDTVEFSDVEGFCRSGVREGILLDFKKDFATKLGKTIAAFANTYGGIILIGVDETSAGHAAVPICGVPLTTGLRERVIQVALDAIYPPVTPEVRVVEFKSKKNRKKNDRAVVVVRVHESELGSHAINNRTTVYLRVDNVSDPFRKATVEELEWFANKREKALQEKSRVIDLAQGHAQQYMIRLRAKHTLPASHCSSRFVFWTVPAFPRGVLASPRSFLQTSPLLGFDLPLQPHIHFPGGAVHAITEGIYFDGYYSRDCCYTEIQQQGLIYHEYGFWWDNNEGYLDRIFVHNIAEFISAGLRYGTKVYETIGYWGLVDFVFQVRGVRGRRLDVPGTAFISNYEAVDDVIEVSARESVSCLRSNALEISKSLYSEVLWSFGWNIGPEIVNKHFRGFNF